MSDESSSSFSPPPITKRKVNPTKKRKSSDGNPPDKKIDFFDISVGHAAKRESQSDYEVLSSDSEKSIVMMNNEKTTTDLGMPQPEEDAKVISAVKPRKRLRSVTPPPSELLNPVDLPIAAHDHIIAVIDDTDLQEFKPMEITRKRSKSNEKNQDEDIKIKIEHIPRQDCLQQRLQPMLLVIPKWEPLSEMLEKVASDRKLLLSETIVAFKRSAGLDLSYIFSVQLFGASSAGAVGLSDGSILQSYYAPDFHDILDKDGKFFNDLIESALKDDEEQGGEISDAVDAPRMYVKLIFSSTETHNVPYSKVCFA